MIKSLPQTASIAHMRKSYRDVFLRLKNGPVMLMNRSTPEAVLVSPEEWNATAEHVAELEFMNEALRRADDSIENDVPWETVKAGMIERGLIDG